MQTRHSQIQNEKLPLTDLVDTIRADDALIGQKLFMTFTTLNTESFHHFVSLIAYFNNVNTEILLDHFRLPDNLAYYRNYISIYIAHLINTENKFSIKLFEDAREETKKLENKIFAEGYTNLADVYKFFEASLSLFEIKEIFSKPQSTLLDLLSKINLFLSKREKLLERLQVFSHCEINGNEINPLFEDRSINVLCMTLRSFVIGMSDFIKIDSKDENKDNKENTENKKISKNNINKGKERDKGKDKELKHDSEFYIQLIALILTHAKMSNREYEKECKHNLLSILPNIPKEKIRRKLYYSIKNAFPDSNHNNIYAVIKELNKLNKEFKLNLELKNPYLIKMHEDISQAKLLYKNKNLLDLFKLYKQYNDNYFLNQTTCPQSTAIRLAKLLNEFQSALPDYQEVNYDLLNYFNSIREKFLSYLFLLPPKNLKTNNQLTYSMRSSFARDITHKLKFMINFIALRNFQNACVKGNREEAGKWLASSEFNFCPSSDNHYAMIKAIENGHLNIVELLLANEKLFELYRSKSWIELAAEHKQLEIVKFFYEKNIYSSCAFANAMYIAAALGNLDTVKFFVECIGVSAYGNFGIALHESLKSGNQFLFNYLCSQTPNLYLINQQLMIGACDKGNLEFVKYLINDRNVNPSFAQNAFLKGACVQGHTEIVKLLLSHPEVYKEFKQNKNYYIRIATYHHHDDVVKILAGKKFHFKNLFSKKLIPTTSVNSVTTTTTPITTTTTTTQTPTVTNVSATLFHGKKKAITETLKEKRSIRRLG